MRALLQRLACLSGLLLAAAVHAQSQVPSALEPWRAWVMHNQEFRACPRIAGRPGDAAEDYLCAWPGVLTLTADASGASIAQRWRVEAESWVPLPGSFELWPQQVSVDGQPAPVVDHEGPSVRLAPGSHEIRARIPWQERPQSLRIPRSIGLIALSVDGKPVVPVQRREDDVTLGRGTVAEPEADAIELHVYRKLSDGVPATLTTVIRIAVSGQAREETIGPALPAGFEPLRLDSLEWPARIDADGRLHVQVQPGSDELKLEARALAPLDKVVARVPDAPWPKQEIWSYESAPLLRVTSATSPLQIDPRQAGVDQEWQTMPAFVLGDGAELAIEQHSRGLADDDRNRLTLDREMWLDFSGDGWFARDRVGGEMVRGWRFDVAPPFALERADAIKADFRSERDESLLVTRGAEPGSTGVEWRTPHVDLSAGVRIASASAALPVTGWQDSFDRVTTTLHLPSGYRFIGAPGADNAAGSWLSAWTLLDVFIAAIVALLAWRLFGIIGAVIAFGYLVLGYQESGAPVWTLLAALAFGLVARALSAGKPAIAAIWASRAALALLVLMSLPFIAAQMRYALHPQLEEGSLAIDAEIGAPGQPKLGRVELAADAVQMASAPASPPPAQGDDAQSNQQLETVTVSGANIRRKDVIEHYSESTVVQTGAGEPGWNLGQRYVLSWSGPVLPSQDVRLVIASPWLVRVLRVALVALLAMLILRLVRGHGAMPVRTAAPLAAALIVGALSFASAARAQSFPPDNLLNELRTHLTEAAACMPVCATFAKAEVAARGDEIRVTIEAHAAAPIALPLPADDTALALRSVSLDGVVQDGLARNQDHLVIGVSRGVHRIELVYVAVADKIALKFPLLPKRIEFAGDGWSASGVNENRLLTETLSLARARETVGSGAAVGAQQFAPFVRVTRDITLGLNWSISNSVSRLAPKDGGFTVSVPALPGEHVSTAGIKLQGGNVTVAIADGDDGAGWGSTLDKSDTLTLTAPALTDRAEVWRVTASPMWHVEANGVPMVTDATADKNDFQRFEFHPLPGETLTLRIGRPQAAEGSTRAIDRASLVLGVGQRASDSVLDLAIRASQGGEQVITLPADAEVMNVTRNGEAMNIRPRDGKLSLPLLPGSQQIQIRFREPVPAGVVTRTPAVAFGLPAANLSLGIDLPADRWLLATGGPAQGPAVLYWSSLVVMLLIAWALARTRRTPLKLWQWILLGVGFSTFSWLALGVVVAWLFAVDWRTRMVSPASAAWFNLTQIALVVLTLAALLCIVAAIPQGLLGTPDMHVAGNGSSAQNLRWFADRSADALPVATALSVPLWVYKLAMLAWAIWLANALVGWLGAGFAAWMRGGYWRALRRTVKVDIPPATAPPPTGHR